MFTASKCRRLDQYFLTWYLKELYSSHQGPILNWFKPMANISTQQTPESLNYIILTGVPLTINSPPKICKRTITVEMRKKENSAACTNITSKNSYTPATVPHRRGNWEVELDHQQGAGLEDPKLQPLTCRTKKQCYLDKFIKINK